MTALRQPSLWEAQQVNLNRVRGRIAPAVLDFCREHLGREFYISELKAYVEKRAMVAPASPDRILRDLRQDGVIDYEVVSRSKSLYRITRAGNGASLNDGPADRSDTSIAAAKDINSDEKLGEWQKKVLLSLVHPATDEKLEWRLGCERTRTSRPRRCELTLAGYVEDSGERIKSDISGKFVTVWRLTPKGESVAARLSSPSPADESSSGEALREEG